MIRLLRRVAWIVVVFQATTIFAAVAPQETSEPKRVLRVFASISLTDCLAEIKREYEKASPYRLELNLTGTDQIAQQIVLGTPVDVVITADNRWMNDLESRHLIRAETRRVLFVTSLVVIINRMSPLTIRTPRDLLSSKVGRIAMGDPERVPSGMLTREYLERQKLWSEFVPRLAKTANGRVTLAQVAADTVGAGFVYKADALLSHEVKIAYEIPATDAPPVEFPAAVTTSSKRLTAAREFLDYLAQPHAIALFKRYGFTSAVPKP